MKFTDTQFICDEHKTSKLLLISLFLPLRGGHFATMETVTVTLRFVYTYFNWKHQEKKCSVKLLLKLIVVL